MILSPGEYFGLAAQSQYGEWLVLAPEQ